MAKMIEWLQSPAGALMLSQVIVAVIVGAASAWVTSRFALRRFKSEKLWERKLDEYLSILACIHRVRTLYAGIVLAKEQGRSGVNPHEEAFVDGNRAIGNFLEIAGKASLILPKKVSTHLWKFFIDVGEAADRRDSGDPKAVLRVIDDFRKWLIDAGKKDLSRA